MHNRMKKSQSLVLPVMPDKSVTFLSFVAGAMFVAYVVLMIVTVMFATVQTSLALSMRETEGSITELETTYYASIAKVNATSPTAEGYVAPTDVKYAQKSVAPDLSFAGK